MSESLAKQRSMIDLDEFERRLHRPAAPTRSDEDPLAELARLVSGNEDPYGAMFAASRAPAVPPQQQESYAPPKDHPLAGDFAAIEAGLLRGTLPQDESWAANAEAYPAASPYDAAPEADPAWEPAYAAPARSRRPLFLTGSVIVLGLVGIGASFALKGHVGGSREIATIEAVPGPTKIQPEQPAGSDVPKESASILDKSPRPNAVALSNNQEQPVDLSRLPAKPKVLSVGNAPLTGAALSDQQAATAAVTPTAAQQPMTIAALIEPKKVRTVSVRPDGTVLPNDQAPAPQSAAPAHAAPVASAATPVAKPSTPKTTARVAPTTPTPKPTPAPAADASTPLALTGAKPKSATPAAKPVAVAKAEADDDAAPAAAASGGGFAVQLAAPGSEHDAKDAVSKLGAKFSSALGGRRPTIRKATVGTRDVFRVRVVNLSREEATTLCQKLQADGGTCFVAKN